MSSEQWAHMVSIIRMNSKKASHFYINWMITFGFVSSSFQLNANSMDIHFENQRRLWNVYYKSMIEHISTWNKKTTYHQNMFIMLNKSNIYMHYLCGMERSFRISNLFFQCQKMSYLRNHCKFYSRNANIARSKCVPLVTL